MVGILLVSHGTIAESFLSVAREILGDTEGILAFGLPEPLQEEKVIEEIQQAKKTLDQGEGMLILTDMFGGTPCNLSLSFLEDEQIEVLTGMNLPMILKILSAREGVSLLELARTAMECGRENIYLAGEILEQRSGNP
jgi:PTS system mannose-specific IIA component